jgi:hypothetical protein
VPIAFIATVVLTLATFVTANPDSDLDRLDHAASAGHVEVAPEILAAWERMNAACARNDWDGWMAAWAPDGVVKTRSADVQAPTKSLFVGLSGAGQRRCLNRSTSVINVGELIEEQGVHQVISRVADAARAPVHGQGAARVAVVVRRGRPK